MLKHRAGTDKHYERRVLRMDELKKRLTRELRQNVQVDIKHSIIWHLPIHPIKVQFETVRQSKMDVLMKMLLTTFRRADFSDVNQLSEVLVVEPIFITHLVEKMSYAGLIKKENSFFALTEKGIDQLDTETFIDQAEEVSQNLLYSPCHGCLLDGSLEKAEDDQLDDYRFYDDFSDWDIHSMKEGEVRHALQNLLPENESPNEQTVISNIHEMGPLKPEVIPCLEFQLYNKAEDVFYARVWNVFLSKWDEVLESQINERERSGWREEYLE